MKTTVKELKAYYVERGGSAATVANITTIPDMIAAITQLEHTSPAVELPKVTSTDNGDVLTVVEGKWAKADSGGGGSVVVVEGTWDGTILTLNKTWKEIHDGLLAGSMFVYNRELREGYILTSGVYCCNNVYDSDGSYTVVFGEGDIQFTASSETGYPMYNFNS